MDTEKCCEQFLNAIQSEFAFLFDHYGFVATICEEARRGEYCLVVFRSPQCQIKFRVEQGTPEYFFGTLEASPGWEDTPGWYAGDLIVAYRARTKPESVPPWPRDKKHWTTEEILDMFAMRLEPVLDDIVAAFGSNLKVDWWERFEEESKERVARIKDQIARGEKIRL